MVTQNIYPSLFGILFFFTSISTLSVAQTPVTLGNGQNNVNVTSSHNEGGSHGEETVNGEAFLPNEFAASRFLAQSTLGADMETIMTMSETSYTEWIDAQFNTAKSLDVLPYMQSIIAEAVDSTLAMGNDPNNIRPWVYHWHFAWWQYVMTSPDVLRAKVGLALSEIFVISELPDLGDDPMSLADYYDMLLDNSFGNFRDLIEDITLHPAMGIYLTHINNPKSDTSLNRFPDENYAREIMQLFTIGLFEMNIDGTLKLDGNGDPIPTYNNDDIAEFAKIYTGLTFGDAFAFGQNANSELSFTQPMKMFDNWHEPGEKQLLNGFIVPDRNPVDGMADINDALDNLFNHENVGPFLARRLIQRMVTSNPSAAYIQRVAEAFNNNGQGVRGDMKAVIKAVLLDPEARDCGTSGPNQGMLREPITRYTQVMRAFNAASDKGIYRNDMFDFWDDMFQRPLSSPSVFNFFQPDYTPIGPIENAGLVSPEFQITNSVSFAGYGNQIYQWIIEERSIMEYRDIFAGEYNDDKYVTLDLTDEMELEELSEVDELLERLNLILMHGQMSSFTRERIKEALVQVPENDWEWRVRFAIYLVLLSPDYLILR